ncbi:MAG: hypothetical protein IRZ14_12310 [Chloroflexi bacterium]|nr:hypothetical protein [Chloroflexota bacterium]
MAKKRNPKSKDFATKITLNPPGRGEPKATGARPAEREVGQYTGQGTPPLQKK